MLFLTGPPGVGKTKLALEGINKFLDLNPEYAGYALFNYNVDLDKDLSAYFTRDSKSILFVDDANRIEKIKQIIGYSKLLPGNTLKIVFTVRNYALAQIQEVLIAFKAQIITIPNFKSELIIDILKGVPFGILDSRQQKWIARIANGNPRIAIMLAKLSTRQDLEEEWEIKDVFEQYFKAFLSDDKDFTNPVVLKSIALVAFFNSVDLREGRELVNILRVFSIEKNDFISAIEKLESLELVETDYDYVRIAEQNSGIYFFFKAFISDKILSFKDLLINYFETHTNRFKDTLIPANNMFGHENVKEAIKPHLSAYLTLIKFDEQKALKFLKLFWFCLEDEVYVFILDKTETLPSKEFYFNEEDTKKQIDSWDRDPYISLISNFFNYNHTLKIALEIAFEYSKKRPDKFPELLKTIKEDLGFSYDDELEGFGRQKVLINSLLENISKGEGIYIRAFKYVSKYYLKVSFEQRRSEHKNTITLYHYTLSPGEVINEIRRSLWLELDKSFFENPDENFNILLHHTKVHPDFNKAVFEFDLEYVIPIINKHLTPLSFKHCYFVHELIRWTKRHKLFRNEFPKLSKEFNNETFSWFKKLDYNRLRNTEEYDTQDYQRFHKLKEQDIRQSCTFLSLDSFLHFLNSFKEIAEWELIGQNDWYNSLDIVLDENIKQHSEFGILYVIEALKKIQCFKWYHRRALTTISENQALRNMLWLTLNQIPDRPGFDSIKIRLLLNIPESEIHLGHVADILKVLIGVNNYLHFDFHLLEKFTKIDPDIIEKVLRIIVDKNDLKILNYRLDHHFFIHYSPFIKDLVLMKKAYIQQDDIEAHYDYEGKDLLVLLKLDSGFLNEYLDSIFERSLGNSAREYHSLSVVWELEQAENMLDNALPIVCEKAFHISEHFANAFFYNARKEEVSKRIDNYIIDFIKRNATIPKMVNMMYAVILQSKKELLEEGLKAYLEINKSLEDFRDIDWIGNGGVYSGKVNISEHQSGEWAGILSMIDRLDLGISIRKIRNYVVGNIDAYKLSADKERKRRFIESDED